MSAFLSEQNCLLEKIVTEYGDMIKGAVRRASGGMTCADDIVSEVYFAILLTVRKLGDGWIPPRSFIFAIIRNKVNDFLRLKYRERNGFEEIKRRLGEESSRRQEVIGRIPGLTHCEFQVFRLLGLGLTNQEIAATLHISLHTVRSHVKKVHAKSGVRDRAKLCLVAHQVCYREEPERETEELDAQPQDGGAYLRRESRGSQEAAAEGDEEAYGSCAFLIAQ